MRGHLRLGLPGEFGAKVVMPLVAEFRTLHPDVTFSIVIREPQALMPDLTSGRLDVVVCDDGNYLKRFTQISCLPLAREDLVLTASAHFYDQEVRDNVRFDHLKTLSHVAYVDTLDDIDKWYGHHFGKTPKVRAAVVADNVHAVLAAVRSSLGLGLLPAQMIDEEIKARRLRVIDTGRAPLVNKMQLIRLKDRVTSAAERAFVAALKERSKTSRAL